MRVFNQLVYNTDPNLGNLLITKDWKVWMIDFTRAFRRHKKLQKPGELVRIDRRLYEALRTLRDEILTRELGDVLTRPEIAGVLARRDEILKHFEAEIASKGRAAVIYELAEPF